MRDFHKPRYFGPRPMKKSISVLLLFLSACATTPPTPSGELSTAQQRTTLLFDSANQKIHGDAMLATKGDLSKFTLENYEKLLGSYTSSRPSELRAILPDFETKRFRTHPHTFVFCIFSSKQQFAMCDDPKCTGVEYKLPASSDVILDTWAEKLPLKECPRK